MSMPPEPTPVVPFYVSAGGRTFHIAPLEPFPQAVNRAGENEWFVPVDCTWLADGNATAQAIVEGAVSVSRDALAASGEIREAIATAARSFGGAALPDGFTVEMA